MLLRSNLIVFASCMFAGKTLVAELLLLRKVIKEGKKAIFIVPFVSMAREKANYLQVCGVTGDDVRLLPVLRVQKIASFVGSLVSQKCPIYYHFICRV